YLALFRQSLEDIPPILKSLLIGTYRLVEVKGDNGSIVIQREEVSKSHSYNNTYKSDNSISPTMTIDHVKQLLQLLSPEDLKGYDNFMNIGFSLADFAMKKGCMDE